MAVLSAEMTTSPSPPAHPHESDVWHNTLNGRSYSWTIGPSGRGAWVATPTVAPKMPQPIPSDAPDITNPVPKITMAGVPPLTPVAGDLWFDTVRGYLFVFYDDGNTTQWVVANPGRGGQEGPPGLPGSPSGPAGGDLFGSYPDPVINPSTTNNWLMTTVSGVSQWAAPPSTAPSGSAGGDLTGIYPNPLVKADVALGGNPTAITQATSDSSQRLATTAFVKTNIAAIVSEPPSGPAGGDLAGTYPNPTIKANVNLSGAPTTTTPATADNTTKIPTTAFVKNQGYALSTSIPTTLPPSGPAGGALAGTYPNPGLAVPYPTTLPGPPTGAAGGDLSGSYPNPTIKPSVTNGQVLTTVAGVAAWAAASGGGASISVGDTPPASPGTNALWWNSVLGTLMLWYTDPNTSQWVVASPSGTNRLLQEISVETGAMATGSAAIPFDDTIPQITEGTEFMTLAITPQSATSKLIIEVVAQFTSALAGSNTLIGALFQDANVNALAANVTPGIQSVPAVVTFRHVMTSGTTSSTTFRFRAGLNGTATITFNGFTSARIFGGVMASSIVIREVAP